MLRSMRLTNLPVMAIALASAPLACGGTVQPQATTDAGKDARDSGSGADARTPDAGAPDAGLAGCRSKADCTMDFEYCAGPYDGPCMGGCAPPTLCAGDAQCDGGTVCRQVRAAPCGAMSAICYAACQSDVDCPPTQTCVAGGHCQPRTCAECPAYFSCTSGTCTIPTCTGDSDCPEGYCVNGSCGGALGTCTGGCG
jgi:hypothetical protein